MKCAFAIFAKTIGLSPVKTRLAADIGAPAAEAFYQLSKDSVAAAVMAARRQAGGVLHPVWALAEPDGPTKQKDSPFPAIWTGEGGLGQRLASVSERLFETHDAVFMIGTDSPQLEPRRFLDAIAALDGSPAMHVAGPAADGGFYLFGSTVPVRRNIWEEVQYSASCTLAELEWRLDADDCTVQRLPIEQDVDTCADLETLRQTLDSRQDALLGEQARLLEWLEVHRGLYDGTQ